MSDVSKILEMVRLAAQAEYQHLGEWECFVAGLSASLMALNAQIAAGMSSDDESAAATFRHEGSD